MNRYETQLRALRAAFPYTIPIFAGFWFLGLTYGIYMNVSGFSFVYPMLMSLTIFAGSVEFITVNLLLGAFNPLQALFLTLMVNARHLFYGLSMLDKFRGLGWKKVYLIFGMCDESFSINYTAQIPPDVDRGWFMFFVTLLNHFYWFSGSTLGGVFGGLIQFNTEGLDFVMTAMFVVIFLSSGSRTGTTPAPWWGWPPRRPVWCSLDRTTSSSRPCWPFWGSSLCCGGPWSGRGRWHDPDTADHHHRHGGAGDHDYPLSPLPDLPRGEGDS